MARRFLAHAVDADMAALDQRGGAGAGLHHPRVPQPFVETLSSKPLFCLTRFLHANRCPLRLKTLLLARELLLERSELCERRIRIGGAIVARIGARRILAQRRTGLAVAAAALVAVTAAAIAAALCARTCRGARPCPCPRGARGDSPRSSRLSSACLHAARPRAAFARLCGNRDDGCDGRDARRAFRLRPAERRRHRLSAAGAPSAGLR